MQLYFTYFNVWLVERLAWDPVQLAQAAVLVSVPMMLGSWIGEQLAGTGAAAPLASSATW